MFFLRRRRSLVCLRQVPILSQPKKQQCRMALLACAALRRTAHVIPYLMKLALPVHNVARPQMACGYGAMGKKCAYIGCVGKKYANWQNFFWRMGGFVAKDCCKIRRF